MDENLPGWAGGDLYEAIKSTKTKSELCIRPMEKVFRYWSKAKQIAKGKPLNWTHTQYNPRFYTLGKCYKPSELI